MKSSRNRSRSKGNRNRSVGNIVNRVFDSSGPEGKVRGTPQQIIDKYNQLTRDAQLSNDRVAAENFQQHAEHYLRMLSEAQREQEARREQQNQQNQQNQQSSQKNGSSDDEGGENAEQGRKPRYSDKSSGSSGEKSGQKPTADDADKKSGASDEFNTVIDTGAGGDSGLVETPETASKPKRTRTRRPRKSADEGKSDDAASTSTQSGDNPDTPPQEAAE